MSALDTLLGRLADARKTGADRWRAACPVCGGRNKSSLSIGEGHTGAVLLKCFKDECEPAAIAHALGLEITDLFPPKESHGAPLPKRRLLSAQQALDLLYAEANLVCVAGSNLGHGVELHAADRQRLLQAATRIAYLRDEVMA